MSGLITKAFRNQAVALPEKVDEFLAGEPPADEIADQIAQADVMKRYAERIKATTECQRPIAVALLKLKGGYGNAIGRSNGGRGKTTPATGVVLNHNTLADYRKIGDAIGRVDAFADVIEKESPDEIPTQAAFLRWIKGAHVSNNSGQNEWYTPPEFISAARKAMSGIDLDPATSEVAQQTVKAKRYYTADDDGLTKQWRGRVWMNPPYSSSLIGRFTGKLVEHVRSGDVAAFCCLVNNATETDWFQEIADVADAVCFPSKRIKFHDEDNEPRNTPLQGQAILYGGSDAPSFLESFESFGLIMEVVTYE